MAKKKKKKKKTTVAPGEAPPSKLQAPPKPPPEEKPREGRAALAYVLSPWLLLAVLMAIGFGFRYSNTIITPLIYPDSLQYMSLADEIKSGEIFSRDYNLDEGFLRSRRVPPLYSTLLAVFSFIPVEAEVLGVAISTIFGLLTFVLIFRLGRTIDSDAMGLCAAAIFTFQWFGLRYATPLLTEATFTFLYILILVLSLHVFARPRPRLLALLGFLCSICYMTRDLGITCVFWSVIAGVIYWRWIEPQGERPRPPARLLLSRAGIIIGVFLVVSFPYFLHIRVHTGHWGLTPQMGREKLSGQIMQFGGSRIDRDRVTEDLVEDGEPQEEAYFEGGDSGILVIPKKLVVLFKDYLFQFLSKSGWFLSIFFFLGIILTLVYLLRSKNRAAFFREAYVLIWVFQLIGLYALVTPYMVDERYIYPIMPLGMLVAAGGMVRLGREISDPLSGMGQQQAARAVSILTPVLLVLIAFIALYPSYKVFHRKMSKYTGMPNKYAAGHKEVARELINQGLVRPGKTIMSRKPFMAYYLKGEPELLPKTFPELLDAIEQKKMDYIVADSFVFHALRPLLFPLAFGIQPDPDAEVVDLGPKGLLIKQFKVTHSPPPNTKIIMSRYFPEYFRVITIYEVNPEPVEPGTPSGTARDRLAAARARLSEGDLCLALEESRKALLLDPQSEEAYRYIILIYGKFYTLAPRAYFLDPITSAAYSLLDINPWSEIAKEALSFVKKANEPKRTGSGVR